MLLYEKKTPFPALSIFTKECLERIINLKELNLNHKPIQNHEKKYFIFFNTIRPPHNFCPAGAALETN